MTRRSLFGLIPGPFAAGLGLLTTSPEPTEAPDDDELALAALALGDLQKCAAYTAKIIREFRAEGKTTTADTLKRECLDGYPSRLAEAERDVRERLAVARDVSVLIGGRVYTAGRSRGNHLVTPDVVAMLTTAEGGGL